MKTIINNLVFFIIIMSIFNCKPKTTQIEPLPDENNLKRVWMLVEFENFKREDMVKNKAQINLTDLKNPTANMGCNRISFQVEVKENNIKFLNSRSTRMFCENAMALENAFSKSLAQYYTFNIEGQKLTLVNSKNEKMVFVAQDWD